MAHVFRGQVEVGEDPGRGVLGEDQSQRLLHASSVGALYQRRTRTPTSECERHRQGVRDEDFVQDQDRRWDDDRSIRSLLLRRLRLEVGVRRLHRRAPRRLDFQVPARDHDQARHRSRFRLALRARLRH